MSNEFEPSVASVVQGEGVSAELQPLLLEVFRLLRQRAKPTVVADAIEELLLFLCSPSGRTNANCVATDHFFALDDDWGEVGWEYLPVSLGDVLAYAGGALDDAVSAPEIAENFYGTPEQLLARLRASRQEWHVV
jgi:hypothetical protein